MYRNIKEMDKILNKVISDDDIQEYVLRKIAENESKEAEDAVSVSDEPKPLKEDFVNFVARKLGDALGIDKGSIKITRVTDIVAEKEFPVSPVGDVSFNEAAVLSGNDGKLGEPAKPRIRVKAGSDKSKCPCENCQKFRGAVEPLGIEICLNVRNPNGFFYMAMYGDDGKPMDTYKIPLRIIGEIIDHLSEIKETAENGK